jgi:hypothetical protein
MAAVLLVAVAGCASQRAPAPEQPIAILDKPPDRYYEPVWPVSARAEAKSGKAALYDQLREKARDVGADAVIIERRYFDPSPAPGDGREAGLGDPYPELLESLEPGACPHASTGARVYGPYVIAEGVAIRYPAGKAR